jgi:hypothetical protein
MLDLIAMDNGMRWHAKPAVCLLRKFSIADDGLSAPVAEHTDMDVCVNAMESLSSNNPPSVHFLIADELRDSIRVTRHDSEVPAAVAGDKSHTSIQYEMHSGGQKIGNFLHRGKNFDLTGVRQLMIVVGLEHQSTNAQHRNACLEIIRRIRQERPSIYAQFVCWKKSESTAVSSPLSTTA